ncbi:MAG: magnesium transporter [Halanaerobiales bacterium]
MIRLLNEADIRDLIPEEFDSIEDFFKNGYSADIAELLMRLSEEEIRKYIDVFDIDQLSEIISYLDYDTNYSISRMLSDETLADILTRMYKDDAVDFLGTMPVGKIKKILNILRDGQAQQLQRLLGYDEESAGGLMTTEFIAFYQDNTTEEVFEKLRSLVSDPEMIYYIYVISRTKELKGVLSLRQLLAASPNSQLEDIMTEQVIKVEVNRDQEEIARILAKYDLLAVPVINSKNQLVGIITVDDAMDVIEDEATEDIYKLGASTDVYETEQGALVAVKKRIPWLIFLLFASLMASSVIQRFEASLKSVVALVFFIPVLMNMGGNVGIQSLTVMVRGLAIEGIDFSNFWRHLLQEIKAGLLIALIIALLLFGVIFLWQNQIALGLIVAIAMFTTILTAIGVGVFVPFIMQILGADPAMASGPFITTIVDVTGLYIYFAIANLLLEKLF